MGTKGDDLHDPSAQSTGPQAGGSQEMDDVAEPLLGEEADDHEAPHDDLFVAAMSNIGVQYNCESNPSVVGVAIAHGRLMAPLSLRIHYADTAISLALNFLEQKVSPESLGWDTTSTIKTAVRRTLLTAFMTQSQVLKGWRSR
jgi:hypothetical protein